ncbi:MAG: hypothetical protein ACT4PT_14335 [Methanobacteriota archaeon]
MSLASAPLRDLLFAFVFWLLCWGMAALVYAAAPRRTSNRLLAVILFLEGSSLGLVGTLLSFALDGTRWGYAANVTGGVSLQSLPPLYLAFLGSALATPLVAPFRGKGARRVLLAASALIAFGIALWPHLFMGIYLGETGDDVGLLEIPSQIFFGGVALFGLVASVSAYRRAEPASLARSRARSFAMSFGVRDAVFVVLLFLVLPLDRSGRIVWGTGGLAGDLAWLLLAGGLLVYVVFLGHGGLRGVLLDVDVKIRWTLRQSTVAATFVAVFFVVSEFAKTFFAERAGLYLGVLAAGALVFVLAPLQRVAERFAEAAMPGKAPAALDEAERLALYREQLSAAWADGVLTKDERNLLERLRERLGIAPEEATRIEGEVTAG